MDEMAGRPTEPEAPLRLGTARGRWVVAAAVLGSGMAGIDSTVVGIALPSIGRQFHAGLADLQWVSNGYTLTLAALLLFGGSLGDRHGRRRIFVTGTVWFAVASLLCGLAPNAGALVVTRALQGVGGALLTPGSLAILETSFAERDRAGAIGAWSGLGGVAAAIGPFLGGWLIASVSWRLIFFINLPVAAAVAVIARRHVPESTGPAATGRVDLAGAVLASIGLAGVIYALTEGSSLGWSSSATVVALTGGVAALWTLLIVERRRARPMLPLELFHSLQFAGTNLVTFVVYAGLGGALFLLPIALQEVSGYSPLAAGASLLPITAIMLVLSTPSGNLASRIGPRLQMTVGPLLAAAGIALLARVGPSGDYVSEVLPAVAVLGLGLAVVVAPLTATAMSAASDAHSGIASAVNNDVARVGGLIAVATLPALGGISGLSYLRPAEFAAGFHIAAEIAAGACAAGGLLAAITIRNPSGSRSPFRPGPHCALDGPPLGLPTARTSGHSADAWSPRPLALRRRPPLDSTLSGEVE